MTRNRKTWAPAAAAAVTLTALLVGCNGSDTDPPAAPPAPVAVTDVPDSAGASITSFFSFLMSLSAADETGEPLNISATLAVPADEGSEPTAL